MRRVKDQKEELARFFGPWNHTVFCPLIGIFLYIFQDFLLFGHAPKNPRVRYIEARSFIYVLVRQGQYKTILSSFFFPQGWEVVYGCAFRTFAFARGAEPRLSPVRTIPTWWHLVLSYCSYCWVFESCHIIWCKLLLTSCVGRVLSLTFLNWLCSSCSQKK